MGGIETEMMNPFFQLPNENPLRCHVFCFPGAPANKKYSLSHFSQITRDVTACLKATGHEVFYYGYEECDVLADEKIVVGDDDLVQKAHRALGCAFGHMDPTLDDTDTVEYLYERWAVDTEYAIKKRYEPGDLFLWILPGGQQKPLYDRLQALPVRHIEPSVGYIGGFLPYRAFQSQYVQAFHYGMYHANKWWYATLDEYTKSLRQPGSHSMHVYLEWGEPQHQTDTVIPIPFDISNFDFRIQKKDYLLCLARVCAGKGIAEAVAVAKALDMKLIIAGPGDVAETINKRVPDIVEVRGAVGVDERRILLSEATALLCLSELYETLGMAALEAMLSGTVPITSAHGAFLETIEDGYNGYHVDFRSTEQAVNAVKNVDKIDPYILRDAGLRYSREYIAPRYDAWFQNIDDQIKGCETTYPAQNNRKEKVDWPKGWITPVDKKEIDNV